MLRQRLIFKGEKGVGKTENGVGRGGDEGGRRHNNQQKDCKNQKVINSHFACMRVIY